MHVVTDSQAQSSSMSFSATLSSTRRLCSLWQCASPWQPQNIVHGKLYSIYILQTCEHGVSVEQPHLIISSTPGGATLTSGCKVTRHVPIRTWQDPMLEVLIAGLISKWQSVCARFTFSSNTSLVGGSDLSSGAFATFFQPILRDQTVASSMIAPISSDNTPNLYCCTPLLSSLMMVLFPMSKHRAIVSQPKSLNGRPFPKQWLSAPVLEVARQKDQCLRTVVSMGGDIYDNLFFHLLSNVAKGLAIGFFLTMLIYKC